MNVEMENFGLSRSHFVLKYAKLNPVVAYESESINDIINKILVAQQRTIPIISNKKEISGIVTSMDILDSFLRQQNFNESIEVIMNREIIFCEPYETLNSLIKKFNFSKRGNLPVVQNNKILGMVSEREIIHSLEVSTTGIEVSEIMTKKPFFINSIETIKNTLKTIVNSHYRRLPVLSGKKLTGIITAHDMLKYLKSHNFNENILHNPIENIMIKNVITVPPAADIFTAVEILRKNNISGLPVVGENLEGIITEKDIIKIIS